MDNDSIINYILSTAEELSQAFLIMTEGYSEEQLLYVTKYLKTNSRYMSWMKFSGHSGEKIIISSVGEGNRTTIWASCENSPISDSFSIQELMYANSNEHVEIMKAHIRSSAMMFHLLHEEGDSDKGDDFRSNTARTALFLKREALLKTSEIESREAKEDTSNMHLRSLISKILKTEH